jgi:hypothetical protein
MLEVLGLDHVYTGYGFPNDFLVHWRLRQKYVIRDFHPLVFFYAFGFLSTLAGLGLGISRLPTGSPATRSAWARSC